MSPAQLGGRPVYVRGAAAVSAHGFDWRGLGRAVQAGATRPGESRQLAASHGRVNAFEVPAIPAGLDVDARALKLMSHPARLAAVALRLALDDAGWGEAGREDLGLFMGVGASGGAMDELSAMLDASIVDQRFSVARFGQAGLAACNPLYAFQLMNNFTLCHGAILEGLGGPNGAFYSRGTGTLAALWEAWWQVADGQCAQALAGAADSALHPVTWDGLRETRSALVPGEGAALLALSGEADGALARVAHVGFCGAAAWQAQDGGSGLVAEMGALGPPDLVVLSAWDVAARDALRAVTAAHAAAAHRVETAPHLGEALAATPALAWCVALDLLQGGAARRAWVLSAGPDGGLGVLALEVVT